MYINFTDIFKKDLLLKYLKYTQIKNYIIYIIRYQKLFDTLDYNLKFLNEKSEKL